MTLLLRFWREVLILALFIGLCVALRSCRNASGQAQAALMGRDSIYIELNKVTLRNGQIVTQVQTAEATVAQLRTFGDQLGLEKARLKAENVELSSLVSYWKGKARVHDTIQMALTDTVYLDKGVQETGKEFGFQGKYLQLTGFIPQEANEIHVDYTYNVDFNLLAYRRGKTWFKPGVLVADIQFMDPNLKVNEFRGVVVKQDPPRWYQTTLFKVLVGVAAGVAISR